LIFYYIFTASIISDVTGTYNNAQKKPIKNSPTNISQIRLGSPNIKLGPAKAMAIETSKRPAYITTYL
jgi:hypothetical protein